MRQIILVVALIAVSPLALAEGRDISKVNGGVRAEAGQAYGNLETVNGGISVGRGARVENVETVNGGIDVGDQSVVGSIEAVNGGIDLGEDVQVEGDVETVNGGIDVARRGRIGGRLETVNGRIALEATEVGRGIHTVNGDIEVGADSVVRGGILVEKPRGNWFSNNSRQRIPRVVIGPNAVVEGVLEFQREVELFVHDSATIGAVQGAEVKRFSGDRP